MSTTTENSNDRLIDFREVYQHLGLRSKTAHTALEYARRGLIEQVRLTSRTYRYTLSSVLRLAKGELVAADAQDRERARRELARLQEGLVPHE